jgi:pilus assembly protein Flp/PilA
MVDKVLNEAQPSRLPSSWGAWRSNKWGCIMSKFINMLKDESGASAAEYALILAIVGAAIAFAAIFLGSQIATAVNDAGTCISTNGQTCN